MADTAEVANPRCRDAPAARFDPMCHHRGYRHAPDVVVGPLSAGVVPIFCKRNYRGLWFFAAQSFCCLGAYGPETGACGGCNIDVVAPDAFFLSVLCARALDSKIVG